MIQTVVKAQGRKRWVLIVIASLAIAAAGEPPRFTITTKRKDDTVNVVADKEKTVFVVKSPFGISQAAISRQDDHWPKVVVLRLHLKGLEHFKAANGKSTLHAAVSIQDGKAKVRQWKDGNEDMPLNAKSPLWADIRIVGANELPLKAGHFEVTVPNALFEGNPKTITVNWIDYYRN